LPQILAIVRARPHAPSSKSDRLSQPTICCPSPESDAPVARAGFTE
jgi:hypothetical protein